MKKIVVISIILSILFVIVYFKFRAGKPVDPRGYAYAGSAACAKCHSNVYNSYLHTAHYIASVPASANTVHGSFAKTINVFNVSASQKIVMEKRDGGMFQTWYLNGKFKESHRFDIVLGGVKGESYLYWKGNGLNQLPVSYYTKQNKWLMSPRYAPGFADFNRIITSRCMECHAAYIGNQPDDAQQLHTAEQFDKSTLVYSIDCERCHGPGAQHVDFQSNNPGVKTARFITRFSSLPRARRMDLCGVCHSGNKSQMLRSTFGFRPGDTLANFKLPDFVRAIDTGHLDVHGSQLQLLESSKCFINSKMDCATCHDTHQNQRGNTALFTQKCLGCHSTVNHNYCKMANALNAGLIKSNCIQCHMPALATGVIITPNMDKTFNADIFVHTHHIAIYPQEAKKILMMVGK
jgi:hypothetical protein